MANIKEKSRKHNCNENIQITSFIMNEECRISFEIYIRYALNIVNWKVSKEEAGAIFVGIV